MEYKKILLICIDRDGDIYTKAGVRGPIYGSKKLLDTAMKLGLADPGESDTNALFGVVKLGEELRKEGKTVNVVALIGDKGKELNSDIEISRQLDEALKKYKPDGAIVVTDGADDEYVLPIVESKVSVIALKRVVVKQSAKLESTYYLLQEFLKDIANDPKLSRLLIGLPGIAAILYMLLGEHGWRLIVGVIGVFLFIKGFNLEGAVERTYKELKSSFISGKVSFFTYVVAVFLALVGAASGYDELRRAAYSTSLEAIPVFVSGSVDFFMYAGIVALIGKSIDSFIENEGIRKYGMLIVIVVALRFIIEAISMFTLGRMGRVDLALYIALGVTLISTMALLNRGNTK